VVNAHGAGTFDGETTTISKGSHIANRGFSYDTTNLRPKILLAIPGGIDFYRVSKLTRVLAINTRASYPNSAIRHEQRDRMVIPWEMCLFEHLRVVSLLTIKLGFEYRMRIGNSVGISLTIAVDAAAYKYFPSGQQYSITVSSLP